MPRLARRSAGRQVLARAGRLSDDLLDLEEDVLRQTADGFRAGARKAVPIINASWRRAQGNVLTMSADPVLVRDLSRLHTGVVVSADERVERLAIRCRSLSLASIEDELRLCERTLGRQFAGLATAAVARAKENVDQVVVDRLTSYSEATAQSTRTFMADTRTQMRLASLGPDPRDVLLARLLSESPVGKPGCSGRGMWWRATSDVLAQTRDVSIRLASQVRTEAMTQFNVIGEERGA